MGGVSIAAQTRPDAPQLICSNRSADSASADQNPNLRLTGLDRLAHLQCVIWIVVRLRTVMGSKIKDFVTELAQFFNYPFIERVTSMICADSDSHNRLEQRPGVFQHIFYCKAQLTQRYVTLAGPTEAVQANGVALWTNILVPSLTHSRFNRQSSRN